MYIALCIICSSLIFIFDYFKKRRINNILKSSGLRQPKYTLPIFGNILQFLGRDVTDNANNYKMIRQKFGKLACLWAGYTFIIFVQDSKYFELVLSHPKLIDKPFSYDFLSWWLGNGLLISTGSKWHKRRKIITPSFHYKILEKFVETFDQQSKILIKKLEKYADGKSVLDICPLVGMAALDIITETAMGVEINAQSNPDLPYTKAVKSSVRIISDRVVRPLEYSDLGFLILNPKCYFTLKANIKVMHNFTRKVIEERRAVVIKAMQDGTHESIDNLDNDSIGLKKRMTLLDVLLQSTIDGQPLSNQDIREEVDNFTFAGHDTTTNCISCTLYLVARYPTVQQKLYKELLEVFENDFEKPIRMADLQKLKYMECVIKESLRLYPSVPVIGRLTTEDTKVGNIVIPANTALSLPIFMIARDPECFSNPDEFQPERFNKENPNPLYPYAPFATGPRSCVGQKYAFLEMKSIISRIMQNFELLPLGPEVKPIMSIILRSTTGINVGLKRRVKI